MSKRFLPAPTAPAPYGRPERTTKPATADETEAAENAVQYDQIEAWCDKYMARLAHSVIKTRSGRKNELRAATSGTDSAVLGALCAIMRAYECGCFEASEQAVARFANVDENTAATALRRLENEAYIIRHPACAFGKPTKYSLVVEKLAAVPDAAVRDLSQLTGLRSLSDGDLSDEAYRAKNLGKTAKQVYQALLVRQGQSMAAIAAATERHKSTVKANLLKLAELGMASENDGLWYTETRRVKTDDDLPKITKACGQKRSERRAAMELARAAEREQELARLREQLDQTEAHQHLFDSAEQYDQAVQFIECQIAALGGSDAQQTRRNAQQAERTALFERQSALREQAFAACRRASSAV